MKDGDKLILELQTRINMNHLKSKIEAREKAWRNYQWHTQRYFEGMNK